jgi:hypothetical protein
MFNIIILLEVTEMKKVVMIMIALLFAFAIMMPAPAMAASKKYIEIKVVGKCDMGNVCVQITYRLPGFISIGNEAKHEKEHNPLLVSVRQLDKISWEIIKEGWGLQITELKKGTQWGVDPCNGDLIIKAKICVPPGSGIQLLAEAWTSDGGVYELFYDDPDKNYEYMLIFKIGKGCYHTFLSDKTSIVACGNYCKTCSTQQSITREALFPKTDEYDDISSMMMSVYDPENKDDEDAGDEDTVVLTPADDPDYRAPIFTGDMK